MGEKPRNTIFTRRLQFERVATANVIISTRISRRRTGRPHKHIALSELLALLTRKPRGISYMETHAGRGLYDLASVEAAKTGEADEALPRLTYPTARLPMQ